MTGDSNGLEKASLKLSSAPTPTPAPPAACDPSVVLSHPTPDECSHIYSLTATDWGAALPSEADYIRREKFLTHLPLAQRGSARQWILTTADASASSSPPPQQQQRPILSSCDTLRRRGLVAVGGTVHDVEVQAIGAVYTDRCFRGRGYARRLMELLQQELEAPQSASGHGTPGLSVLFSDIGKTFYAKLGWAAHESTHLEIQPSATGLPDSSSSSSSSTPSAVPHMTAKPLRMHDLAELCVLDEAVLRRTMAATTGTAMALVPDYDTMLWHHLREDFMTTAILGRCPSVRGAVAGDPGRRVWAVWVRSYYSGAVDAANNTMHFLRLAMENPTETRPEYLAGCLRAIVDVAVREAHEWVTSAVHVWNPAPEVAEALKVAGVAFEMVHREAASIPSAMTHGTFQDKTPVQWVANEKFGWY